jgi:magnesium-transporting ATPase (P-type)
MTANNRSLAGFLAFIPLISWIVAFVMWMQAWSPNIADGDMADHKELVGEIAGHPALIPTLLVTFILFSFVLLYQMIHLIKQRNLNNAQKLLWIILMVATFGVGFIVYWWQKMRGLQGDERFDSHSQRGTERGSGMIGDPSITT